MDNYHFLYFARRRVRPLEFDPAPYPAAFRQGLIGWMGVSPARNALVRPS